MNNKGFTQQVLIILIIGIVFAIMIIFYWAGSMVLPILTSAGSDITSQLQLSTSTNNPSSELANATATTGNIAKGIFGAVESIVYVFFIFLLMGFIALCFYVRSHPAFAFFWVFIIIGLAFVSMFVSNAYTSASQLPATSSYYSTWGTNDFLMSNLPIIVVVSGVIGGIFLFILASRDPESEVQTI